MKNKIIIIDDHVAIIAGVSFILEQQLGPLHIDHAEDYPKGLQKIAESPYDLVILDINIPEGKKKDMIAEIKSINKDLKILVFSSYDENIGVQYIQAGADGYLNKLSDEKEICNTVKQMLENGSYFSPKIIKLLLDANSQRTPINPFDKLSSREREISELLLKGNGNLEISNILDIKLTTVSTYKMRIYKKLNVNNLAELVLLSQKYTVA